MRGAATRLSSPSVPASEQLLLRLSTELVYTRRYLRTPPTNLPTHIFMSVSYSSRYATNPETM